MAYTIVASPEHNQLGHPENCARFSLLSLLGKLPSADSWLLVEAEVADPLVTARVHPDSYLEALERAASSGPTNIDPDTYVTPGSYQAALKAAGGTVQVLDAVLRGEARRGFALVRPPGHHATATRAMGFCLLNNIAIAACHALAQGLARVMIVDIDVHHGNGTQEVLQGNPGILYLSTHQSGIYPGSGALTDLGTGQASVVNIPLPRHAGDRCFKDIAERIVAPLAYRFSPQMLLVSTGFDAHWRDPLAELQLTIEGYYSIAHALVDLAEAHCQGKMVVVLEGGYDPQVLAYGVAAMLRGLIQAAPPEDPCGPAPFPEPDITGLLETLCALHKLPLAGQAKYNGC